MSRALWHMHRGTSLKEQMHFGLCWGFFFSIQREHRGLASCGFSSAFVYNGTCLKNNSVNVPHTRTHFSDVGTTTVSAVISIALCPKVQSVKSCVCARVLACNMVTSEGHYTSQSMTFLHVSYAPFSTPPPFLLPSKYHTLGSEVRIRTKCLLCTCERGWLFDIGGVIFFVKFCSTKLPVTACSICVRVCGCEYCV